VTQLERVAEQDEPIDLRDPFEQDAQRRRPAQRLGAAAQAEVQI
jgi:hypothetical protein